MTKDSIYNVGWQPNWAMPLICAVHSCSFLNSLSRPTFKLGCIFLKAERYFTKFLKNETLTARNT